MRFTQLPIGDHFEYDNERYSKTGPLTAVNLENNRQRMIPRSALVTPLSATTKSEPAPESDITLDTETIAAAFTRYHETCLQLLAENGTDATAIRQQLEQERKRFLATCGLD